MIDSEDDKINLEYSEWSDQQLKEAKKQDSTRIEHLSECYLMQYPTDPDAHCTCMDYSPE